MREAFAFERRWKWGLVPCRVRLVRKEAVALLDGSKDAG